MNVNYPSILMIASSVTSLFLSLYAWKHRDEYAVFPLFWLLAVTTIWSFCYGVEVSSTDLTQMKILNSFGYLGIAMIPVLWLIFAARYCGKDHWLTPFNTILLFIIPILSIIMVATNDLHHLFYSTDELGLLGIYHFQILAYGPYWWIHSCYSYLALVWGLVLFIRRFFQVSRAHRWHIGIFIAGALLPFFVNLTYLAGLKPFGFLDLTPIAFIFSGSLFLLGIFTINLFDVTPLALDMLFNNIPDAIIVLDAKNRVINTNPPGKSLLQSGAFQKTINDLKSTGSFITNDFLSAQYSERELKIGKRLYINTNKAIISTTSKHLGTLMVIRDITEHKQAEEALRRSQEEAVGLFQNSPLAGIYHDENGVILNVNSKFTELFGYTLDEVKGKNINEGMIFLENKTVIESKHLTQSAIEGKDIEYETIRKKKDGSMVPVIISVASVIRKGAGQAVVAFYQDITERKMLLEKLRDSEEKYRTLFENMPAVYYRVDKEGNILMLNPTGVKLLGFNSLEEVIGKNIAKKFYYIPEERKVFLEALKNNQGRLKDYEAVLKKKDGTPIVISTNSQYYYDKDGKLLGVEGNFIDITERKRSEEAVHRSQQEFASLFQSHSEALLYVDEEGTILDINKRFMELFGYTLKEIKGKNINCGIIHPSEKIVEGEELDKKVIFRGYVQFETIRKKKDGTLFPVSISGSPVVINGKSKGIIGTYIDITERKKMEEQLKKLARIDPLTGCYNRRYSLELLDRQLKLSQRHQSPFLLAFLDIDHLKHINDTFGHKEGDKVLVEVADLFHSTLREVDIICRMGGDEFLLVFPDSSLKDIPLFRDRINAKLSPLNTQKKKDYQIHLSIGFSEYLPEKPKSMDELIAIADKRMYEEKRKNK